MYPYIVADIGGTHARFALVRDRIDNKIHVSDEKVLPCANFANVDDCVSAYINSTPSATEATHGCFAVAGPVNGDYVELTNISWQFSINALCKKFNWAELNVINDFAAQACAVPFVATEQQISIKPGNSIEHGTKALIGPGTGLGVASLVYVNGRWHPVPGEGGHVAVSPVNEFEIELLRILRKKFSYVAQETILSGPGLVNLYTAVCEAKGVKGKALLQEEITQQGCDDTDPHCRLTLEVFCGLLGTGAGNLALTVGARGGVYLCGGILPSMAAFLQTSGFTKQFVNKGIMSKFTEAVPVTLIIAKNPALIGCAAWQCDHSKVMNN